MYTLILSFQSLLVALLMQIRLCTCMTILGSRKLAFFFFFFFLLRRPSLLSHLADCNGSNNSTDKNHFSFGWGCVCVCVGGVNWMLWKMGKLELFGPEEEPMQICFFHLCHFHFAPSEMKASINPKKILAKEISGRQSALNLKSTVSCCPLLSAFSYFSTSHNSSHHI